MVYVLGTPAPRCKELIVPESSRRSFLKAGGAVVGIAALGVTETIGESAGARAAPVEGGASPTPFGTPTAAIPDPGKLITAVRGDRASNWKEQTRSEVVARHGAVATSQSIAAQAGLRV